MCVCVCVCVFSSFERLFFQIEAAHWYISSLLSPFCWFALPLDLV